MPTEIHRQAFNDRIGRAGLPTLAKIRSSLLRHADGEIETDLILNGKRTDRHTEHTSHILDKRRTYTLTDHRDAFVDVATEEATREKTARVVNDDRRLAKQFDEVQSACECRVRGLLATNHLDQWHSIDR